MTDILAMHHSKPAESETIEALLMMADGNKQMAQAFLAEMTEIERSRALATCEAILRQMTEIGQGIGDNGAMVAVTGLLLAGDEVFRKVAG